MNAGIAVETAATDGGNFGISKTYTPGTVGLFAVLAID